MAATNDVSLAGRARRAPRADRPERRRQDDADQPAHRRARADLRDDPPRRRRHHHARAAPARAPRRRAHVPDQPAVPDELTPLPSLALAVSVQLRRRAPLVAAGSARDAAVAAECETLLERVPPRRRDGPAGRTRSPTASAACSRSRWRSPAGRACCCSTSRSPACPKASGRRSSRPSTRLPADVSILLIEHDMDLVFNFARDRDGARQRRRLRRRRRRDGGAGSARQGGLPRRGRRAWLSCCASTGCSAGYGEAVVVQGVDFALEAGQLARAARPQRHRQRRRCSNTLVGVTRRHGGAIALAGRDVTALRAARARRRRHRLGAAGAQHLQVADGRREPDAPSRGRGRGRSQRVYEMFPRLRRAQGQPGQPALGRRAADARGRPARSSSTRSCCCSTSRSRAWRRSSSRSCCARSSGVVAGRGLLGDHRRAEPAPDPADHARCDRPRPRPGRPCRAEPAAAR